MSTHPNVILLCTLTPNDLARKTMRDILHDEAMLERVREAVSDDSDDDIKIAGKTYHCVVLEGDYHDGWQIGSQAGDLLFFDLVTCGYGDQIAWKELESQKNDLEVWAKATCEKHNCAYKISVTANYW